MWQNKQKMAKKHFHLSRLIFFGYVPPKKQTNKQTNKQSTKNIVKWSLTFTFIILAHIDVMLNSSKKTTKKLINYEF